MLAENDERGIAPGPKLLEALFKKYAESVRPSVYEAAGSC